MLLSRIAAMHTNSFFGDCLHTLHVCTIFGREINVAAKGIVKDTESFSLYDKAHKYEGEVATSNMLMTTTADTIGHC
jgi:hypothetical protein